MFGGKKRATVKKHAKGKKSKKGLVSAVYRPLETVVMGAENIFGSAANTIYNVPASLAKGAKNTVKHSTLRLTKGIRDIGRKSALTINTAASSAFRGKSGRVNRSERNSTRRNSRRNSTRKNSRSNRRADESVIGFLGGFFK